MLTLLRDGEIAVFLSVILALVMSLTFHEFAHAFAAKRFGDDTAQRRGRLTLNPVKHIDPFGLLMVVLIGFGYAKPVPVDPRNLNSFWAQLVIAAAGPLSNLLIATVAYNVFLYGLSADWQFLNDQGVYQFFIILVLINLVLTVFNLIPLGPLDGHYILPYFLPRGLANTYRVLNAKYGSFLFLGLIVLSLIGVPIFQFVFDVGRGILPYITFIGG